MAGAGPPTGRFGLAAGRSGVAGAAGGGGLVVAGVVELGAVVLSVAVVVVALVNTVAGRLVELVALVGLAVELALVGLLVELTVEGVVGGRGCGEAVEHQATFERPLFARSFALFVSRRLLK